MSFDGMAVFAFVRDYMKNGGSFVFMKFAEVSKLPYPEVLRMADHFSGGRRQDCMPVWPLGSYASLARVCAMERARREGVKDFWRA